MSAESSLLHIEHPDLPGNRHGKPLCECRRIVDAWNIMLPLRSGTSEHIHGFIIGLAVIGKIAERKHRNRSNTLLSEFIERLLYRLMRPLSPSAVVQTTKLHLVEHITRIVKDLFTHQPVKLHGFVKSRKDGWFLTSAVFNDRTMNDQHQPLFACSLPTLPCIGKCLEKMVKIKTMQRLVFPEAPNNPQRSKMTFTKNIDCELTGRPAGKSRLYRNHGYDHHTVGVPAHGCENLFQYRRDKVTGIDYLYLCSLTGKLRILPELRIDQAGLLPVNLYQTGTVAMQLPVDVMTRRSEIGQHINKELGQPDNLPCKHLNDFP